MFRRVKGFSIVSEAEVDVFLESPCFFCDPTDVGSLISGACAFSKSSLNIWKFLVHVLLKPSLENFKHYFAGAWEKRESLKSIKSEIKKEELQLTHRNTKACKRLLWTPICQYNGQSIENVEILRKVQSPKTEPERNRKHEQMNYKYWNRICDLKTPNKQKTRTT